MATPCEERGYKVGDRFVVTEKDGRDYFRKGDKLELVRDDGSVLPWFENLTRPSAIREMCARLDQIEKVTDSSKETKSKENNFMSNVVKKIRNLALNKDERLLREMSLVDEQGQRTSDGTDVLLDILFAEKRKEIVEKATELKAQEKEDKE